MARKNRTRLSSTIEKVVLAAAGGWKAPSARYRLGPLAAKGRFEVLALSVGSHPRRERIDQLLAHGDRSAALVLQRVMPEPADMSRLRAAFAAVLFDIDDAIYNVPPTHGRSLSETLKRAARLVARGSTHASARRHPLIRTLGEVDVVIVGNEILGDFVRRYAGCVVEIPTTVEPVPRPPASRPSRPVIAWMGLPDNLPHLRLVRSALERLRLELDFSLRIVSSASWKESPVETELVEWSETASREALLFSTVGIAPLTDDPWTRGKCALRSIQYGGHALPTVASPVGITHRVVLDGLTGYLARTEDEWFRHLRALLLDRDLVDQMGEAALTHVRASYSNELAVTRWSEVIDSIGGGAVGASWSARSAR